MKNVVFVAAAVAALGVVGAAHAAPVGNPAEAQAEVSINVVQPVSVTANENLRFGAVVPGRSDGTVTVAATAGGARTLSGGVLAGPTTGTVGPARFTVQGNNLDPMEYSISVPSGVALNGVNGDGRGLNMTPLVSATEGSNTTVVYVGGTLTVSDQTPYDEYVGYVTLTAQYK